MAGSRHDWRISLCDPPSEFWPAERRSGATDLVIDHRQQSIFCAATGRCAQGTKGIHHSLLVTVHNSMFVQRMLLEQSFNLQVMMVA